MAVVNERKTDTIISSVGFEFNKPVSSSDINEMQNIINSNISKLLGGTIAINTARITIDTFTYDTARIMLKGIKYLVRDANGHDFFGHIEPSINLNYPASMEPGRKFIIYVFYRTMDASPITTVYLNGIRTNPLQPSISEMATPNNIYDSNLGEEVTVRRIMELTFVIRTDTDTVPVLSDWSSAIVCATLTVNDDLTIKLENEASVKLFSLDDIIASLGFTPASTESPHFTGTPTAPTPPDGDMSDKIATTEWVSRNGGTAARIANHQYNVGDLASNLGLSPLFQLCCVVAGTTGSEELDTSGVISGDQLMDGSVLWEVIEIATFYVGKDEPTSQYPIWFEIQDDFDDPASKKIIEIKRGDTTALKIKITDETTGQIITDYDAILSVKQNLTDTSYVLQKNIEGGEVIFEHNDTQNLDFGDYYYDIQVTSMEQVHTYGPYVFRILPDVTG